MAYGKELILDIHNADVSKFNREDLEKYLIELCELIDMEREDLHWWDYKDSPDEYKKAPPHLKGTTAVQFISTSNIVIHTLDDSGAIYINIFSCKEYDEIKALNFSIKYFHGHLINYRLIERI